MSGDEAEDPAEPMAEGQPLPAGATVFRLFDSSDGRVPPEAFELSTDDKRQQVPRLSTWETTRTTISQARAIVARPYSHAGFLPVDGVRAIGADHEGRQVGLDVEWERARDRAGAIVSSPGASGHCGIVGLERPAGTPRTVFKSLRRQLAQLANNTRVEPVPPAA